MTGKLDDISFLLGKMENKLNELSLDFAQDRAVQTQDRADMRLKLNALTGKMETVEEFCTSNTPILDQMKTFRSNLALAVFIVGSLISGVLYVVYWLIANFGNELKLFLLKIFSK